MKLSAFDNIVGHDMVQEWCHPRGTNIYGSIGWCVTRRILCETSHGWGKKWKKKRVVDHFSRASTTRMKRRRKDIFTAAERRRLRLACALPMYLRKKNTTHALSLALSSLGPPVYEYTFEISIYVSFLLLRLKVFFCLSSSSLCCFVLLTKWRRRKWVSAMLLIFDNSRKIAAAAAVISCEGGKR